jgi:periplasmic protein TonB
MFEDSLVESTGRIRTRSKWFALGSFVLQAALLSALILIPVFYPAALPKQALTMMLVAPPPPPTRPDIPAQAATSRAANPAPLDALTAPPVIPRHAAMVDDRVPDPIDISSADNRSGPGNIDALRGLGTPPPPPVVKPEPKPRPGPLRISAGIAAGRLIAPIRPVYPAIAREARIQGTVVVEATISKEGAVEHARVVSGPPILAAAALNAIVQARYQPYKLNGDPVEVETTINVIFKLE